MSLTSKPHTRVQLSFGRELTDEDLKALQTQTDALEAVIFSPFGHHHHDDVIFEPPHQVGDPVFTDI
jgi:hypothetical protein